MSEGLIFEGEEDLQKEDLQKEKALEAEVPADNSEPVFGTWAEDEKPTAEKNSENKKRPHKPAPRNVKTRNQKFEDDSLQAENTKRPAA